MEHAQDEKLYSIASVVVEQAIDKLLDYKIPPDQQQLIQRGSQVTVPIRGKLCQGIVFELKAQSEFKKVLPIHSVLSKGALLPPHLFDLALWMSHYYHTPLRRVIKSLLPPSIRNHHAHKEQYVVRALQTKEVLRNSCIELREAHPAQTKVLELMLASKEPPLLSEVLEKASVSKSPVDTLCKKGLLSLEKSVIDRLPLKGVQYFKTHPKPLNPEQKTAFDRIIASLKKRTFEPHLLFGITGSGKTEVYLQAIQYALEQNLNTIFLVPEIALTSQTIERFKSRFEEQIAILHYRLSEGERHDEWHRIHRNEAKIVIGARSALFSPMPNLGLIIVDEEHEGAYKQTEESPCYHARDVAVMLGKIASCTVVLGTATPSLESYYNTQCGKYQLSVLNQRAANAKLPQVHIIDMKPEQDRGHYPFSERLLDGIKQRVERGEQILLFLNRRGYHTSLNCKSCGHIFKCKHCELPLTFHKGDNILSCHLCDFRYSPPPSKCHACHQVGALKFAGLGTEQVERTLHAIFPEIRTLRVDRDTTRHKGSHERLFQKFRSGKADVLIGTQMIAKGLHFPSVTLAAILNSDGGLQIPDFRASENVFQLITQVAGRAGRGNLPGEVIIQTRLPENSTIQFASHQDYVHFYQSEIETRKLFHFPPFTHLVKLMFSGPNGTQTEQYGRQFRENLLKKLDSNYSILPVVAAGYAKIKDRFRFQCIVKGHSVYLINQAIDATKAEISFPSNFRMFIDVDPLSTFF